MSWRGVEEGVLRIWIECRLYLADVADAFLLCTWDMVSETMRRS